MAVLRIPKGFVIPSGAYVVKAHQIKYYDTNLAPPRAGDVMFGKVRHIGQHSSLENRSGRIHAVHNGTPALFVYANRYAPDYYEAFVPTVALGQADLVARSGLIGRVAAKNTNIKDPTTVEILGHVCDEAGLHLNTVEHPRVVPKRTEKRFPRANLILVCGTSMNSGKSVAASACCWVLSTLGHRVKGSKVTGTASLKDILHMNDAGAESYSDFSFLGYPSTYMLDRNEVVGVFETLDLKYGNNPANYWVVELADGVNQRETAMLLESPAVTSRIHRLVFCANDAFGAIGGLSYLRERFSLEPDLISGLCTSSPLHIREIAAVTDIPVMDAIKVDLAAVGPLLSAARRANYAPLSSQRTV
ncbi:MAG: hypothetical protein ACLFP4_15310 [Spirochaetales bacterium]